MPARASVAAMPGPMVPKPMTAALFNSSGDCKRGSSGFRLLIGGSGRDPGVPGPHARQGRQREGETQAAIDDGSQANIGDRKIRPGDEGPSCRSLLEDLELGGQLLGVGRERGGALLLFLLGLPEDAE